MHARLKLGDHSIEAIRLRGGLSYEDCSPERRSLPGWGALVEVPAVLELFDLVAAGHVDAARARWLMARIGESAVRYVDPHGCGAKGCVEGNHCNLEFEEERLEEVLRRERVDAYLAVQPSALEP
ncbi:hypothetical protein ACFXDE_28495 [Kitasatospora sp. NPDC059408]|uniref:hypothetical protein n=1 Tax=Kitasatospora sp. NPDC059408 TaxID=3346823 RepID=UPI0036BA3BD9